MCVCSVRFGTYYAFVLLGFEWSRGYSKKTTMIREIYSCHIVIFIILLTMILASRVSAHILTLSADESDVMLYYSLIQYLDRGTETEKPRFI